MKNKLNILCYFILFFSTSLFSINQSSSQEGINWALRGIAKTRGEVATFLSSLGLLTSEDINFFLVVI